MMLFTGGKTAKKKHPHPIFDYFDRVDDKAHCRICHFAMSYKGLSYVTGMVHHLRTRPGHSKQHLEYLAKKSRRDEENRAKNITLIGHPFFNFFKND